MQSRALPVPDGLDGVRVDAALAKMLGFSRTFAAEVADAGGIAMDGTPREVFSQVEPLKKLGLDVPPMAELAQMLADAGLPLPSGVLTVDDMVKELKACLSKSST